MKNLERAASDAQIESLRASDAWPLFNSVYEEYAVILEELEELWDECREKVPDKERLRKEAIHVAAMAIRFAAELS
jgi:hypothetical protein